MNLYFELTPERAPDNNGIGRVVHAQFKHLPKHGITFVKDPRKADLVVCHVEQMQAPRIDVLHCHGLYFEDIPHGHYSSWMYTTNKKVIDASRKAQAITVPAPWVAKPFQRDMRISPAVIPHGIDFNEWNPGENQGYILWNKGRADDVCDPTPAWELANANLPVLSTFSPNDKPAGRLKVIGSKSFAEMRKIVANTDIYLATTPETFGIGTLEAMACGVPVLGYAWAGTADLVQHKVTGYLVAPGDIEGLKAGYAWLKANRPEVSAAAREYAKQFDWPNVIGQYADLYKQVLAQPKEQGVAIVIPAYNYGRYLPACLDSVLKQVRRPDEIIVVDDGSTDNTQEVILPYLSKGVQYIRQPNSGVASARMNGIRNTKSSFITLLDADDQIGPSFVTTLERALKDDPGLGIAYSGLALVHGDDNRPHPYDAWPREFDWAVQSQAGVPPGNCVPSGCMFRRKMYDRAGGKIYQEFAPGEDAELWTRGLAHGFTAKKVTNENLFWYRNHAQGASKTRKYIPVDTWLPWVKDKRYPMAAPAKEAPKVWAYLFPKISVIIPVGPGHEQYLLDATRSLEGQTLREWELIVVDDTAGLPEGVRQMIPYAEIIKGRRKGAGAARNDGLKRVRGDFVVFLDADDYLHPQALEKMLGAYDGKGYIYTDWWAVTGKEAEEKRLLDFDNSETKMQHAVTTLMPTVWARQLEFDEKLPSWEDWEYYVQARSKGFCGRRLAEPLLYYRLETGQRRKAAEDKRQALTDQVKERYGKRSFPMCGSCPTPAAKPIMEAKRLISKEYDIYQEAQVTASTIVRMEFTGTQRGSRTFTVNGRSYRGGDNDTNRFENVDPADVEGLLKTGVWQVVKRQAVPVMAAQPQPAIMAAQPTPQPAPQAAPVKAKATQPAPAPAVKVVESMPELAPVMEATADAQPVRLEVPAMPQKLADLRKATLEVSADVLMEWEYDERQKGDKARKAYLEILRAAIAKK